MESLLELDERWFLTLNALHAPWLDVVMKCFSNIPLWIPLYLFIVALFFMRLPWRQAVAALIGMIVVFALTDSSSVLIKDAVQRIRPSHREEWAHFLHLLESKGGLYSFVSSHAANVFGLAFFSSRVLKKRLFSISMFTWATLVGYSRIYVGKHFPGDVLCGALLGLLIGWIILWIYTQITHALYNRHLHKSVLEPRR